MSAEGPATSRRIIDLCHQLGFAAAGISEAAPTRYATELRAWLAAGKHGSMAYLERHLEARLDPSRILEGARSIIVVADLYSPRGSRDPAFADGAQPAGRIARYSRGRDYHTVIKKRLHALADQLREGFPGAEFRAVSDTAPLLEREYAARAGIGWIGRHTLLIHPRLGSYMLLGGLLTTLELVPPEGQRTVEDHCGTCTRCIDACPTGAITPYSVDASRCISYLTIERRLPIAPEFHEPIGEWIFGCDVCQEVCPHNSPRPGQASEAMVNPAYAQAPGGGPERASLPLLEVLGWTPADRARAFEASAMKRATLTMMKRNALIVAGNLLRRGDDPALRQRLDEIACDADEDPMVRQTALEVRSRLTA